MMLSAVEAVEVFVEIAARQSSNPRLRWIFIFCLEVLKLVTHFINVPCETHITLQMVTERPNAYTHRVL